MDKVGGSHQAVQADTGLACEMMEHQRPPAQAIGTYLERGPVRRKRVGPAIPWPPAFLGNRSIQVVFSVVKYQFETPVAWQRNRRSGGQVRKIRCAVTVEDVF